GGKESYSHLCESFEIPSTVEATTGGGGTHLYFRHPGIWVPTKVGIMNGIDVRGDGGYVVAPPSRHASGKTYFWESPPDDATVQPIPSWLTDSLHERGRPYK